RRCRLMEAFRELATAEASEAVPWTEAAEDVSPRRRANLWRDAWRRLLRNKLAMCGLIGVAFLLFLAVFADVIAPNAYDYQYFANINEEPSWQFPMGTDLTGRDMLSRMIYGARVSMSVALVSQLAILLIAVPLGSIAGYFGGWIDNILMRVVDVFYAIPALLL